MNSGGLQYYGIEISSWRDSDADAMHWYGVCWRWAGGAEGCAVSRLSACLRTLNPSWKGLARDVFRSLKDGPMDSADIAVDIGFDDRHVSAALRILRGDGLVRLRDGKWERTEDAA